MGILETVLEYRTGTRVLVLVWNECIRHELRRKVGIGMCFKLAWGDSSPLVQPIGTVFITPLGGGGQKNTDSKASCGTASWARSTTV